MFDRAMAITERVPIRAPMEFDCAIEMAIADVLVGDHASAAISVRRARGAFEQLEQDARRTRLPRLLRVKGIVASAQNRHASSVRIATQLSEARLAQYTRMIDPMETLRDEIAILQIVLRAGSRTQASAFAGACAVVGELSARLGPNAPSVRLAAEVADRIRSDSSDFAPLVA